MAEKIQPFPMDAVSYTHLDVYKRQAMGCVLPIGAKVCKLDPAIMAGPLITTVVDAVALVIFFNVAQWLVL